MRKLLLLLLCSAAFAQGVRFDLPPVLNSRGVPIANPQISLCTGLAVINGATCSIQATSFTDITLGTACAGGSPVTLANSNVCRSTGDSLGNAGFWLAPGAYIYCVTAPSTTGQCYNLVLPAGATSAGALTAKTIESIQYADQYQGSSTTCGVMEAIAALPAGGGTVWLPLGSCTITSGISYTKLVHLRGHCGNVMLNDNTYGTITPPTPCSELVNGTTGTTAITVNLPASNFGSGWSFSDFSIKGNRNLGGATAGECIRFVGGGTATVMRDIYLSNVTCREPFNSGFRVSNNTFIVHFNNVRTFRAGTDGLLMDATTGTPSQVRVIQSDFDLNNGCGIHISAAGGGSGGDLYVTGTTMADSSTSSGICVDNGSTATVVSEYNHYEANNQDGIHLFGSSNHVSHGDVFFANGVNDYNLSCAGSGFAAPFLRAESPNFLGTTPTNWRIAASCNRSGLYHPLPANPVIVDAGSFTTDYVLNTTYNFGTGVFTLSGTPFGAGGTANIVLKDTTSGQTTPNKTLVSRVGCLQVFNSAGAAVILQVCDTGNIIPASGNVLYSATAPTIAAAGCGGAAASIVVSNGTAAFKVNVGTTPGSACTLTFPAAATGWNVNCNDITTQSTSVFVQKQTGAESTTSVTITNFNDVAAATAFVASDILKCTAFAD